mgnify:CR=1 FL=1
MNHLTTNLIETFNKEIKCKEQLPNEGSFECFLVTRFLDKNDKFDMRCHRVYEKAKSAWIHMFETREDEALAPIHHP